MKVKSCDTSYLTIQSQLLEFVIRAKSEFSQPALDS